MYGRHQIKPKKPTLEQASLLRQIAQSRLVKTYISDNPLPLWQIDGGKEISHKTALTLIRNGWIKSQRDGLPTFGDTQSYVVLNPSVE